MRAWVGTSGFSYKNWLGLFYPKTLPQRRFLEFYAERFRTVELNAPFYRLPAERTLLGWASRVPENFRFAVKAWRVVTHRRRLVDMEEDLALMASRYDLLADRLGPVLFQLPPNLKLDLERLDGLLAWLERHRPTWQVAVEFRHESWFTGEVFERLRRAGCALCIAHSPTIVSPRVVTADFLYVRFHGTEAWFRGSYAESLPEWASWIRSTGVSDAYCYFNNEADGSGVGDAAELARLLAAPGGEP